MLAAIEFDRQPRSAAGEVGDIMIDLELADEFLALAPTAAEMMPEAFFGLGLIASQSASDRSQLLPAQRSAPSPNPLPIGERAFPASLS